MEGGHAGVQQNTADPTKHVKEGIQSTKRLNTGKTLSDIFDWQGIIL